MQNAEHSPHICLLEGAVRRPAWKPGDVFPKKGPEQGSQSVWGGGQSWEAVVEGPFLSWVADTLASSLQPRMPRHFPEVLEARLPPIEPSFPFPAPSVGCEWTLPAGAGINTHI